MDRTTLRFYCPLMPDYATRQYCAIGQDYAAGQYHEVRLILSI